jgi:hypothetical protein
MSDQYPSVFVKIFSKEDDASVETKVIRENDPEYKKE